jgi:phosphoribosylanthranilate isomerase
MVKVKICGITNLDDALFCSNCGADALGFIFYRGSPRYIPPSKAKKIIKKIGPFVIKVGVFVDRPRESVARIAQDLGLDVLQFHGQESPTYCHFFKKGFQVIKTVFATDAFPPQEFKRYKVDAYLFDVAWKRKLRGEKSLGLEFFKRLAGLRGDEKIIASGGLNPKNITALLRIIKPYAVDVASGVESLPGKKDKRKVLEFIKKVKCYEIT